MAFGAVHLTGISVPGDPFLLEQSLTPLLISQEKHAPYWPTTAVITDQETHTSQVTTEKVKERPQTKSFPIIW